MTWIVVLSCGDRKAGSPRPAYLLYTGTAFISNLTWARSVMPLSRIYILSAKHGLIPSSQEIAPYDLKMGSRGSASSDMIKAQALILGVSKASICFIGGQSYYETLRHAFDRVEHPTKGLTMGYRAQWMKRNRGKFPYS